MKHYKKIPKHVEERQYLTHATCDICNSQLERGSYELEEININYKVGTNYPEGGSGEECSVDLCGKCFKEKLIPFLESNGVDAKFTEWSW